MIEHASRLIAFIVAGTNGRAEGTGRIAIRRTADVLETAVIPRRPIEGPIVLRVAEAEQRLPTRLGAIAPLQIERAGLLNHGTTRIDVVVEQVVGLSIDQEAAVEREADIF